MESWRIDESERHGFSCSVTATCNVLTNEVRFFNKDEGLPAGQLKRRKHMDGSKDNGRLRRLLEQLGVSLGVNTGSYSITVHDGKARKLSIRTELQLQDAGETEHLPPATMPLRELAEFVEENLEAPIRQHLGNYGHADVVMHQGKLKHVVLFARANLAM